MKLLDDLGIIPYLTPIVMAFSFAVVLVIHKEQTKRQWYLGLFLFTLAISMAACFFYDRYITLNDLEILRPINLSCSLLCATMALLYMLSFCLRKLTKKCIYTLLSASTLFALALFISDFFFPTYARYVAVIIVAIFEICICLKIIRTFLHLQKEEGTLKSNDKPIDKKGLLIVIGLLAVFAIMDLLWNLYSTKQARLSFNITALLVITVLFIIEFRQNEVDVASEEESATANPSLEKNSEEEQLSARQRKVASLLLGYFEEKKPYLDPELSLAQVSDILGINMTYLSRFLNQVYKVNFYTFVNNYRIDHAIFLIEKNEGDITSDMLYNEAGFKSRSVFYRLFRERTGLSPQEYIKENIK